MGKPLGIWLQNWKSSWISENPKIHQCPKQKSESRTTTKMHYTMSHFFKMGPPSKQIPSLDFFLGNKSDYTEIRARATYPWKIRNNQTGSISVRSSPVLAISRRRYPYMVSSAGIWTGKISFSNAESPPTTRIWVPPPRDGQNWGTPYGDAAGLIIPDFPGMGRACSDLGVTALVCRKKSERCCFPGGGSPFWKNGTRHSAFWSWWAIQIFRGKLDNFWILWKSTMIFSF